MLIAYVIVSTLIGMFTCFIWSTNGFANTLIKMFFGCFTIWSAAMLLSVLNPVFLANGMRLF